MKRTLRALSIARIAWRYGLDQILREHWPQSPNWRLRTVALVLSLMSWGRRFEHRPAVRLRLALQDLGPIFVKLGQVLSTRRDLLGPDLAQELALLQDQVPAFDSATAMRCIEEALGQPIAQVFTHFDPKPVASASIAQVHFATLRDKNGQHREVAVKVLRPGMLQAIEKDLGLMHRMAHWLQALSVDGKRLKPREVVAEFDKHLHNELDLLQEAANAAHLRRNMADVEMVLIPQMHWDFCRSNVLVMERMTGIPMGQWDRLRAAGLNFSQLAKDGVTIFFTQVFRDGFFHADMHPGNIQISTDAQSFGRYIALDFGIVGTLSDFDKEYLAQNFNAFFKRDYRRVAALHIESGWVPAATRVEELEAAIRAVCEPYFDRPLKDISLGMVLLRLFQVSRRFNVEIQPQLVLLQKTLLNVEGLARELDPELDLWRTAKPFLEHWMKEQIGFKALWRHLKAEAPYYSKLLPQLPRLLHQHLQQSAMRHTSEPPPPYAGKPKQRGQGLLCAWGFASLGFVLGVLFVVALSDWA